MCILTLAKKINIYNRNPDKITLVDKITTYIFIISLCIIIYIYSIRYYHLVELDIKLCETKDSKYNCVKGEFINVVVPYIGILFGFAQSLYMTSDKIALFFNYLFCCIYCCNKRNPNLPIDSNTSNTSNTQNSTIELPRL